MLDVQDRVGELLSLTITLWHSKACLASPCFLRWCVLAFLSLGERVASQLAWFSGGKEEKKGVADDSLMPVLDNKPGKE